MKLFYREYGNGEPLIILHGLFGMADNWNTLGKKFGEHFRTIIVDQRNHGQSPHDTVFNYQVMADDLKTLMDDLSIDRAHLMGHSMGGKTVMFFATRYPERVNTLIVSDIAPRYYTPHHKEVLHALRSLDLAHITSRKEAESQFEQLLDDWGTRQFLLKNLYWQDGKLAWRFYLDTIEKNIDAVGEALPENALYEGPVMFVKGSLSRYIKDDDLETIHLHFPRAVLVTIEGAGHWIHAEKPIEYFDAVMNFLP